MQLINFLYSHVALMEVFIWFCWIEKIHFRVDKNADGRITEAEVKEVREPCFFRFLTFYFAELTLKNWKIQFSAEIIIEQEMYD